MPVRAPPLLGEVQDAFAGSLRTMFLVMIGIAGLGLLASLCMKDLELTKKTDERWGLKDRERTTGLEAGAGAGEKRAGSP